jgi:hypothetical protein
MAADVTAFTFQITAQRMLIFAQKI